MKYLPILGILLILLAQCTPATDGRVVYILDQKESTKYSKALEKIISEVYVVPLETTEDCLIDYYISAQFSPDMIFLLEGPSLQMLCFDRVGKFIRKFGTRGKGPGEYSSANGLLVNSEKDVVLLNRFPSHTSNFYDLTGKFTHSENLDFGGHKMELINDDFIAIHAGRIGLNEINNELAISDFQGNIQSVHFPYNEPLGGDCCVGFAAGVNLGSLLYHKCFDFNIYEVYPERIDTLLSLDFGISVADTGASLNVDRFNQMINEAGKILGINSIANTQSHLLANIYESEGNGTTWILDHLSKNYLYLSKDTLSNLGTYKGIPIGFTNKTFDSWFISAIEGLEWYEAISKLSESQKQELRNSVKGFDAAEKVTMEGNPVLVYYKFKSF